jgi:hypothetical protein
VILLAGLAVVVASVPLAGRRLGHALALRLRSGWLVGTALLCQTVIVSVLPSAVPRPVAEAIHLSTYAMAIAFVWRNRHIRWLWLVSLGGGLNLAAIAANHGVMPASRAALATAGIVEKAGFANSAAVTHARLAFLGDVFAIPHGLPLANVFSVGDMVLIVGAALLLHAACRPVTVTVTVPAPIAEPAPAPALAIEWEPVRMERALAAPARPADRGPVARRRAAVPDFRPVPAPSPADRLDASWDVVAFAVETVARGALASAHR